MLARKSANNGALYSISNYLLTVLVYKYKIYFIRICTVAVQQLSADGSEIDQSRVSRVCVWAASELRRLHRQQIVNGCVFVAAVCFQYRLDHLNLDVWEHIVHGGNIFVGDWSSHGRLRLLRWLTCIGGHS